MFNFLVVKTSTGEIERSGVASNEALALVQLSPEETDKEIHLEKHNGNDYYWLNCEQVLRSVSTSVIDTQTIIADGVDKAIITLIEAGAEIFINNVSQGVNPDTDLELTFDTAGSYAVRVDSFPALSKEFIINAN